MSILTSTLSRRELFALAPASLGVAFAGACTRPHPALPPEPGLGLTALSVATALQKIRKGEMTAEAYTGAWLTQLEAAKPLQAVITIAADQALNAARIADRKRRAGQALPPLHGLPLVLKDVMDTAGIRTTYATARLRSYVPRRNAWLVERLLKAGAHVLAKSNCDELNFGSSSQGSAFGGVRNPYNRSCIPGGSSGGSAALVGGHFIPLAFGADTTGSIRMPAALCGAKGFRPTTGRYPTTGVWPVSPTLDAIGPLANAVADLSLIDRALTGDDSARPALSLRGLRLGVIREHYVARIDDQAVITRFESALGALVQAGVILIECRFPESALLDPMAIAYPLLFSEAEAAMRQFLSEEQTGLTLEQIYQGFTPDVKAWFDQFVFVRPSPFDQPKLQLQRKQVQALFAALFAEHQIDALILPATPFRAPKIGQASIAFNRGMAPPMDVIENTTAIGAVAASPGVVLPVGTPKPGHGLPVGVELQTLPGQDRKLLAIAEAVERVLDAL